jgi:predicted  nucleic acid-binding Zn-ribbon protein
VHPQLEALLLLQSEDDVVDAIEARLDLIAPRLAALDAERAKAARQLEQTIGQLQAAERKQRDVAQLVAEHRQRQERNVAQFDLVKRMREAEAAQSQVETGRKLLADGENDLREIEANVAAIRQAVEAHQVALQEFDATQDARRAEIEAERSVLAAELAAARGKRDGIADHVPAGMRTLYDKMRVRRRKQVVYPIAYGACSACDTSVPVQRGKQMALKGTLEACEGCGMLLYATE